MRTSRCATAFVLLSLLLSAGPLASQESKNRYEYDANRPLLTLHGPAEQNSMADLDKVLKGLLVNDAKGNPRTLVIYVHGRGFEPRKSFDDSILRIIPGLGRGKILKKIEGDDVRVLGVNWNSKPDELKCGRPIDRARSAGVLLSALIKALANHRIQHPTLWQDRRTVLLVHSMGGFVLESAVAQPGARDAMLNFFDIRMLTAADVPAVSHATWLPSGTPGQTYVLSNPEDGVLADSMACDPQNINQSTLRLGLLKASDTGVPRANEAIYAELPVGKTHRLFTRGGANKNPIVCNFVRSLVRGRAPQTDPTWRVRGNANLLQLPEAKDSKNACVAGVAKDDEE